MNEIIRMNTSTLLNKDLAKSVNEINKAVAMGQKSSWMVAEEFTRIVDNELFEDDFDNEKQFAEFVGISKGYLSQCKRAVDFKNTHSVETTVSKAYIFSTLDDYDEFNEWVLDNYGAPAHEFSDKCIKDFIKEFKAKDEPVEEVTEEPADDVIDEVEEVNNIMVEVVDAEGIRYIVPMTVLNQYRVEE